MVQIGLMIEGQDGLNWNRWKRILQAAEELPFAFVFRSDHFINPNPPDKDSLELWTSLTYAASHTERIGFGPLVAPVTFRHPSITARVAAAVDDLSGGRLVLGLGAGWNEREHRTFGIPFPPQETRLEMLEEYLRVVILLLRSDEHVSFSGNYYSLDEAILLPRPERPGGPPILVGGNGRKRTMPLAARYADEWNALFVGPERLRNLERHMDSLLDEIGRPRDAVTRSVMMGTIFARDERAHMEKLAQRGMTMQQALDAGWINGTPQMWAEQLSALASAGAQRIMLQWLDQDNIADLEIIARDVLPAIASP
ncbi:MAG TPA: TIGR03560 family F420-dependent LLM class oxidoreductase [Chloroflexota bacterium]